MVTRWGALLLVAAIVVFVGAFIWATLRQDVSSLPPASNTLTATISEVLSDGRIDAQIFALAGRDIRLEIQFAAVAGAVETVDLQPTVTFAMAEMHMYGIDPPLERVEAGVWRTRFRLPMAGRWIVSVGFGEEFAEVEFDAR